MQLAQALQAMTVSGGPSEGQNTLLRLGTVDFDVAAAALRAMTSASSGSGGGQANIAPAVESAPTQQIKQCEGDEKPLPQEQQRGQNVSDEELADMEQQIKESRFK